MAKRALITGFFGQDGCYLAELLLSEGYEVFGFDRRLPTGSIGPGAAAAPVAGVTVLDADLSEDQSLIRALEAAQPDEVYNLASFSFVPLSFKQPLMTTDVNAVGVLRLLEALRQRGAAVRFFQASTGEMYGRAQHWPQDESMAFDPTSPYAVTKVFGYHMTRTYRDAFGLHASNGILFNHESPRRAPSFVTRKITQAVARIKHGLQDELRLGNLEARRDWGFAGDYVRAMWLMLQQDEPDDYVVASGVEHTVREFCQAAFGHVGLDYEGYVVVDPDFYRPVEVHRLVGDPSKARKTLGWEPRVGFEELVAMMVDADMELVALGAPRP